MTTQKTANLSPFWILAEQENSVVNPVSFELIARARKLAARVHAILLVTPDFPESAAIPLIHAGADEVVLLTSREFAFFHAARWADALTNFLQTNPVDILIAAADSIGRTLLPYTAMRLHTGLTADCTELAMDAESGLLLQTRPAIGGNVMATIVCRSFRPQMATIRPHSYPSALPDTARTGTIVSSNAVFTNTALLAERIRFVQYEPDHDLFSIENARRVVVVGRGIRKPENIPAVKIFAEQIGAALGATREVVDRGWLPYRHQIGLSGKTISPELYIGLGVSGAIQHLAGMQTAKNIIAVNKDPDAQIFKVANLGIVGDVLEILPELATQIRKEGSK